MRLIATLAASAALLSFAAAASAETADAADAPSTAPGATERVVVRPVHANGTPVAGYSVSHESISGFSCGQGPSPVAVDPNIRFCGYSATYTVACWKSTDHTALCLRDPRVNKLVRIRYTGSFDHVAAPKRPSPQALRLGNSSYCLIRDGGAWSIPLAHPSWVGFYSCSGGDVYGPPSGDGIDRTHRLWTVYTGSVTGKGQLTRRVVAKAYYAGTAS